MSKYYEQLLPKFIAKKSISTDPKFKKYCEETAEWLVELFSSHGFTTALWPGVNTNPTVFASYEVDPGLPTILVYGHYDVQPADKQDGWQEDPFSVRESDTHYYARGIIDNKGQVLIHIANVLEHIEANTLGYNVKFLIEGNEESGNTELPGLVAEHVSELACDAVLVSDGQIIGQTPLIECSLRGGGNLRITLCTATNDLHSGIYGGAVPSASETLVSLLSRLHDENNRVTIPDFYEGVAEIDKETINKHKAILSDEMASNNASVKQLLTPNNTDFLSQTGLQPALMISGVASGYVGTGFKNIVPATAEARINIRTVIGQNTDDILELVATYLKNNAPSYATVEVEIESHGDPIELSSENQIFSNVSNLLSDAFQEEPIPHFVGGSIPIIADLQKTLQKPIMSIPLANEDCNMHGVEENFSKAVLEKGMVFSRNFWRG